MAPFSQPHRLIWSQEGGRQVGVPRREEAAAAAAAAAAVAAAAVAAHKNKRLLSPWWQPQGARPE